MKDIDTAAIRADASYIAGEVSPSEARLRDSVGYLCDALDAARAERKWMTEHRDERTDRLFVANRRAEAAESRNEELQALLYMQRGTE